jgi:hypothetical protein
MRKFRRWLRKPFRRERFALGVGGVLGCASFLATYASDPSGYPLGWLALAFFVAMAGSACAYSLSARILRPAPIEPFADGEIGIVIDSDNLRFQRAIALQAASTPLAGRLAFRTAGEPMALPIEQETKDALQQGMKARLLLHEATGGQVRLVVIDGPPVQSKSAPFVFYGEIYEWLLSEREEDYIGRFVVAYVLYRRELYEQFMRVAGKLGSSPEAQFLQGCAVLRMNEPPDGELQLTQNFEHVALCLKVRERVGAAGFFQTSGDWRRTIWGSLA